MVIEIKNEGNKQIIVNFTEDEYKSVENAYKILKKNGSELDSKFRLYDSINVRRFTI